MKLKQTIQLIEYSNSALITGLIIGVIAIVWKARDGRLFIFEMLIAVALVLTFLFRKLIINIYLKKSLYPGVFYSVLDKLGLTKNLEITLTDDLLNEIYKPGYSTSQFLNDNNLKTEIGAKKIQLPFVAISIAIGLLALFYVGQKPNVQGKLYMIIFILVFLAMYVFLWAKGKKQQNDNDPITFFKEEALVLPNTSVSWKDIFDYNYQAGDKFNSSRIIINYYDSEKNIQETIADLDKINITKIDFFLLMIHFKGKYG